MQEYTHNGERVIFQQAVDECFIDFLNGKGIVPEELPDDDFTYCVFKYTLDGKLRYAAVQKPITMDAYVENIYITFAIPEDGWLNLIKDVEGQQRGEEPKKMQSRLSLAYEYVERRAREILSEKYPDADHFELALYGYPKVYEKEYLKTIKYLLLDIGYTEENIMKVQANDVDKDYLKKIFES